MTPENNRKSVYPSAAEKGEVFMPRMSKKRKLKWQFFLNQRNRITYNPLCRKCVHGCKQSFQARIVECPRYHSKRAKRKGHDTL
jgi:CO dehydrogenase/acetyl-CoA synthase alpha subunit